MDVQLDLECHVESGFLRVRYAVTNHGRLPLVCYDGVPGIPLDAPWPDAKEQIYVSFSGDAIALKRINPPQPPGVLMTASFIPALSLTMPGERREVRLQLAEPLTERSQYTPQDPSAHYRERTMHQVQMVVSGFWKTPEMNLIPYPANPHAFRLRTAHGPASFFSAVATQTVTVRERI